MTMYRPRFCYANKITSASLTVSSNSSTKVRLIDRNHDRKWVAVGEGTSATITATVTEEIDTIVILNTNASAFTVKYDGGDFTPVVSQANATQESIRIVDSSNSYLIDSSSNFIVSSGIATRTYNNYYFKVNAVTPATSIVLSVTNTTDGNAVRIGQVVYTKQIYEVTPAGTPGVVPGLKQIETEMSDGTLRKIFIRSIKGFDLTLNNATPQDRGSLIELEDINRRDALFYIHRPAMYTDYFDGLCGHMNYVNPLEFDEYYNDVANNGFTGIIRLRQAGGTNG